MIHLFRTKCHFGRHVTASLSTIAVLAGVLTVLLSQSLVSARPRQTPSKPDPPDQAVRLKTDLVDIRAVVTDNHGKPVTNLKKEDFEVLENGHSQPLTFFSAEDLKAAPAVTRPPVAAQGAKGSAAPPTRRTVVFFVDTLNMSTLSLLRVKGVLLNMIDQRLGEGDVAAVVATTGGLGVFSQFTQDRQVLHTAVNRLGTSPRPWTTSLFTPFLAARVEKEAPSDETGKPGSPSLPTGTLNPLLAQLAPPLRSAMNIVRAEESWPDNAATFASLKSLVFNRAREILLEASYRRKVTMLTLQAVAARLAEMPGQRLIFMLSDGFTMQGDSGDPDSSDFLLATSRASRSGEVIYTVGARGLTGSSLYEAAGPARFTADSPGFNEIAGYVADSEREMEDGLRRIAAATGGEALLTTNDLAGAMDNAVANNSFYYGLAYYAPKSDSKSAFRNVKVRVKGHSDYHVRAQGGYLASEFGNVKPAAVADPVKGLIKAMGEPLAATGINVNISADFLYLPTDKAQVSLNVFIDADRLGFKEQEGGVLTSLTMMTGMADSAGNSMGLLQDLIQIRLSPEQLARAREGAYRYSKRIILKPGLYQIRVGVLDPQTESIGTASAWVEVPNLESKRLALSSLTTGKVQPNESDAEAQAGSAEVRPNIRHGINLFHGGEAIAYSFRAYNAEIDGAAGLMGQVQILCDGKIVREEEWRPLSSLDVSQADGTLVIGGRLSTDNLKANLYQLRFRVKQGGTNVVITRETSFEIVPERE